MPSLKAIASDLGVSHALVSRVLNNRMGTTRVSKKTREAILQRAKELDYQPNPLAVALKKGRKGVVGVFMHKVGVSGSEMSLDFIQAAGIKLSELGLNLWLQFFEQDEEFLRVCNSNLLRKVDGVIVAGLAHSGMQARLREIELQGLHVVSACQTTVTERAVNFHVTNFQVDYVMQCYLTTEHLIAQGCRKIAHFNFIQERLSGYQKAHLDAGLEADPRLCISIGDFTTESGYIAMKTLIAGNVEFDGIVTQSDAQAAGAMRCLVDSGWPTSRWPKMTGVDDSPIAEHYCHIPLTSVTAEMKACADNAVTALFQKIEGNDYVPHNIPPQLVVRQSSL